MTRSKELMKMYGAGYPGAVVPAQRSGEEKWRAKPPSFDQLKKQMDELHARIEALKSKSR